jgi:hypothetical protein
VQIPLKKKYRWKPKGKYGAVGDDNLKRVRRPGPATTVVYNPREHVLYLKPTGGTVFLHGQAATSLLNPPD